MNLMQLPDDKGQVSHGCFGKRYERKRTLLIKRDILDFISLDYKSMNHKLELFQDVEIEIRRQMPKDINYNSK